MVYTTKSDVEPLVKFIDDEPSTDLYTSVLKKADDWVNSRLLSHSLSIWTSEIRPTEVETTVDNETVITTQNVEVIIPEDKPIPSLLNTAASYYAVSDIVLSLYQGEDMLTQYDIWFKKAEDMLNAYITQQEYLLATTELANKNLVKHSKSKSYNQKRGRFY